MSFNKIFVFMLIESILLLSVTQTSSAQNNSIKNSKKPGYAQVNGLNMYYEVYGTGSTPLVLIHGGGSTIETSFGNLLPLLSKYGKIIAVELQAHGRTSDRATPESFEQDADDVVTLLKHLKVKRANILGFSNGGTTTMQIAIRHPEVVNKIIVISANHKREGLIAGFFEGMQHATLDHMPKPLQTAFLKVTPDRKKLQNMFEKDKKRMLNFKDYSDDSIRSIAAKTLLIVAQKDVVTIEHTMQIAKLIPDAQLVVLPGTHGSFIGEICSIEKGSKIPEATAILITDFLKK